MDVYEKHSATFRNMSAYVVVKNGQRVARIAFKDGTTCQAFAHWIGATMIRAVAKGGGYDRHSAALATAARKASDNGNPNAKAFWDALREDNGSHWDRMLENAGFEVWQAV